MKKHQTIFRTLTLMLSTILLFVLLPFGAIAQGIREFTIFSSEIDVYEIEELRQENVKHFRMSDGQYTAVMYNEAVHRKDSAGIWQDIDNSLTLQNGVFATNDGRVKLAKNANSADYLMAFLENGYGVELSFADQNEKGTTLYSKSNVNSSVATVTNAEKTPILKTDTKEERFQKLSRVNNKATLSYAEALSGVDVEYTLSGNSITEKILLKNGQSNTEIAFLLTLSGLSASLTTSGEVALADKETKEIVYIITPPTLNTSQANTQSTSSFALQSVANGSYLLTLNVINPTSQNIMRSGGTEETEVAFSLVYSTTAYGSNTTYISPDIDYDCSNDNAYLEVGTNGRAAFIHTYLPNLPEDTAISDARLNIWPEVEEPYTIQVYRCTVPWYEYESWTYSVASNVTYMDSTMITSHVVSEKITYGLDVTSLVSDWYEGECENYGVVLLLESGGPIYVSGADLAYLEIDYSFTPSVEDGVYYIQNVQHALLMQSGAPITAGTDVLLDEYSGLDDQKWKFTFLGNGFYAITSADGENILTSPNSANVLGPTLPLSADSVLNDQLPAEQQWRLKPSNNGYVLASKEGGTWVGSDFVAPLCLGTDTDIWSPHYGYMHSATDITTLNEVWNVGKTVLKVRFDESYVDRYGGGSETSSVTAVRNRIRGHMEALLASLKAVKIENPSSPELKDLESVDIEFVYSIDTTAFECYACLCLDAQNYNNVCRHAGINECEDCEDSYTFDDPENKPLHHTNINNIANYYYYEELNLTESNIPILLFIGHSVCEEKAPTSSWSKHRATSVGRSHAETHLALVYNHRKIIQQTYDDGSEEIKTIEEAQVLTPTQTLLLDNLQFERETVLHEVGHLFGAPDHYAEPQEDSSEVENNQEVEEDHGYSTEDLNDGAISPNDPAQGYYNDYCIYGLNRHLAAMNGGVICPGCQIRIKIGARDEIYKKREESP